MVMEGGSPQERPRGDTRGPDFGREWKSRDDRQRQNISSEEAIP